MPPVIAWEINKRIWVGVASYAPLRYVLSGDSVLSAQIVPVTDQLSNMWSRNVQLG